MLILGISTATPTLTLGLMDEDKILAEYSSSLPEARSENLVIFIDSLIKKIGLSLKDIKGVAVTLGPGSYAGIRGGVVTAKSLAQVSRIPLAGVSTLEAIAYNLVDLEGTIASVTDARRDEYNLALFAATEGKLKRLTSDLIAREDRIVELFSKIRGTIYLVGDICQIYNLVLEKNSKSRVRAAEAIHGFPRGVNVARLGLVRIKEGRVDDGLTLAPYYSAKLGVKEFKSQSRSKV